MAVYGHPAVPQQTAGAAIAAVDQSGDCSPCQFAPPADSTLEGLFYSPISSNKTGGGSSMSLLQATFHAKPGRPNSRASRVTKRSVLQQCAAKQLQSGWVALQRSNKCERAGAGSAHNLRCALRAAHARGLPATTQAGALVQVHPEMRLICRCGAWWHLVRLFRSCWCRSMRRSGRWSRPMTQPTAGRC